MPGGSEHRKRSIKRKLDKAASSCSKMGSFVVQHPKTWYDLDYIGCDLAI